MLVKYKYLKPFGRVSITFASSSDIGGLSGSSRRRVNDPSHLTTEITSPGQKTSTLSCAVDKSMVIFEYVSALSMVMVIFHHLLHKKRMCGGGLGFLDV